MMVIIGTEPEIPHTLNLRKEHDHQFDATWYDGGHGWRMTVHFEFGKSNEWMDFPDVQFFGAANSSDVCTFCRPGYYAEDSGMASCAGCTNGTFQSKTGSTACISCLPGKYNLNFAMISEENCTNCQLGRSNSLLGHGRECKPCQKGRYANQESLSRCVDCPGGYVSDVVASESPEDCVACDPGSSALPGSFECEIL